MLADELMDPQKEYQTVLNRSNHLQEQNGANEASSATPWQLIDPSLRRGNFSALMSTNIAFEPLGDSTCFSEGAACVPVYRIRFMSTLYTALKPWFSMAAYCLPTTSFFAKQVNDFLVAARIGTSIKSSRTVMASRTGDSQLLVGHYCLDIPSLSRALSSSMAFACYWLDDMSGRLNCHGHHLGNQNRTRPTENPYGTKASAALFWEEFQWDSKTGAVF
jgi:hypothetical protein